MKYKVLIGGFALTLLGGTSVAQAAPVYTENSASIAVSGSTVTAKLVVAASEPATVKNIKLCVRNSANANLDRWKIGTYTLTPTGYTINDTSTWTNGTYKFFSCFQRPDGTWFNGPHRTVTVPSAGSTTPTVEPTAPVTSAPPPPSGDGPVGVPGDWQRVFTDEFSGTALDAGKWNTLDGKKQNNVINKSYNVSVSDGKLVLKLRQESDGSVTGGIVSSSKLDGWGRSGFEAPVGSYTEARVYFPGTDAQPIYNFPAAWTSGHSWPSNGEIDYAEGLSGRLTANYHYGSDYNNHVASNSGPIAGTWHNAYHTYGVHRTASKITWYWDGKPVRTITPNDKGGSHTILFNVGKSNSRTPVLGDAGAVKVDYVRVWQYKG